MPFRNTLDVRVLCRLQGDAGGMAAGGEAFVPKACCSLAPCNPRECVIQAFAFSYFRQKMTNDSSPSMTNGTPAKAA